MSPFYKPTKNGLFVLTVFMTTALGLFWIAETASHNLLRNEYSRQQTILNQINHIDIASVKKGIQTMGVPVSAHSVMDRASKFISVERKQTINIHSLPSKQLSRDVLVSLTKFAPPTHQNISIFPEVSVTATGYTAGFESTGKKPDHPVYGITFSGVKVRRDFVSTIAADPTVFPLGTLLYVPGYGYGLVADTGSAIKGRVIDLYYENIEQVFSEWGKRKVKVYIIHWGSGKVTEQMLDRFNHQFSTTATP
jgi:3D (Asp-Asp-Asp) domain-containing protein